MRIYSLTLIFILASISLLKAQDVPTYPVVGKPCPDFVIKSIFERPGEELTLEDLKGKHAILDFWGVGCSACIASFPKMSKIQEKYRDKLNIVYVGLDKHDIRTVFKKYQERDSLHFISTFDTLLFKQFQVRWLPTLIWIDGKGIVKAITQSTYATEDNIERFLRNEEFEFYNFATYANEKAPYDKTRPFLINGNGGSSDTAFRYRSVLTEWKPGMANYEPARIDAYLRSGQSKYEALCTTMTELFKAAYFGNAGEGWKDDDGILSKPILETKDSLLFKKGTKYCYSLSVPREKGNKQFLMKAMQRDLETYFGLTAAIEERWVDFYYLVDPEGRGRKNIRSKGINKPIIATPIRLRVTNNPFKATFEMVNVELPTDLCIIDATGIPENEKVDVDVQVRRLYFDEIKDYWSKMGFDLEVRKTKVKVLVIRDAEG